MANLPGPGDEPLEDYLSDEEFMDMCNALNQDGNLGLAIDYCEDNSNATTDHWRELIRRVYGR